MKVKTMIGGILLFFGSQGFLTLYASTSSLLLQYLIFVIYMLCIRHIFIHFI